MPHLMVDERKCKADGICAEVCPVGIIEMREGKRVPVPSDDADHLCIGCGHCVAVCPHGAMSLDVMSPEDCPPLHRDMILTPEQASTFEQMHQERKGRLDGRRAGRHGGPALDCPEDS